MGAVEVMRMDGSSGSALELPDDLLQAQAAAHLVRDVVEAQRAALRRGTAAVKNRARTAGSMRKLHRQKGTGRARVGNSKAVQRRGGGVAHGPVPRLYTRKVNRKVRRAVLRGLLAERLREGALRVVENWSLDTHKTAPLAKWLAGLDAENALLVVDNWNVNLERAAGNLPRVQVIHQRALNAYALLRYPKVIVSAASLEALQERLSGEPA